MPIEVQHSSYSPGLDAALSLLLAQPQPPQQPTQPQGGMQDIISQLAPLLAGRQQPPPAYQGGYANPANYSPNNPAPSYIRPQAATNPADHSAQLLTSVLAGNRTKDQLQHEDQLAQFRAAQQNQHDARESALEQQRQKRQNDAVAMTQGDLTARWAQEVPPQIQQGIADGSYKYSAAQKKTMADAMDAINRVAVDPTFTPEQRERIKAQAWIQYKTIHSSPMPVPIDERPITPQQQYEQSLVIRPVQLDDGTTINLPLIPHMRAGGMDFKLSPEGEVLLHAAKAKIDQQKQVAIKQAGAATKTPPEFKQDAALQSGQDREMFAHQRQMRTNVSTARFQLNAAHQSLQTAQDKYAALVQSPDKDPLAITQAEMDLQTAENAVDKAQQRHDFANSEYEDATHAVEARRASVWDGMQLPPPQNPPWVGDGRQPVPAASGQSPAQPSSPSVSSPDDLRQQLQSGGLNVGDTVNTPFGLRPITQDVYNKVMGANDRQPPQSAPQPLPGGPTTTGVDYGDGSQPTDQSSQPAAAPAAPPQLSSPDDLRAAIKSGTLKSGDTVQTPSGPHTLTDDDVAGA